MKTEDFVADCAYPCKTGHASLSNYLPVLFPPPLWRGFIYEKKQIEKTVYPGSSRIISVSRRTDIPAFYGDWFMRRLNEGFARYMNPFGGSQHFVSLTSEKVACFVFWSKNFEPFMDKLKEIKARGYNCYFQFTINALPKIFESKVVQTSRAIKTLKDISRVYSPAHINWRYDPIVITEYTDDDFHLKNFQTLASQFEGYVNRCYFSFPTFYGKVKRNVSFFEKENGFPILDPSENLKIDLSIQLAEIACQHGITMNSCCGDYLVGGKIEKAHCIDGDVISSLYFSNNYSYRLKPSRAECGCAESTDIGAYDICPNGCIYCYANVNQQKAQAAYVKHDHRSEFLGLSKRDGSLDRVPLDLAYHKYCQ